MASGIYAIRHMASGKVYVGSTVEFKMRWDVHLRALRKGEHHSVYLQRAWTKHGEGSFEFKVLEECGPDREVLIAREQHWMDTLKSYEARNGYNISDRANGPSGELISKTVKEQWTDPGVRAKMIEGMKKNGTARMKYARSHRKDYSQMKYVSSCVKNHRNQFRIWTPEDDAYLREHYATDGINACAKTLNRGLNAVKVRASQLGLRVGDSKRERYRQAALVREAARRLA